MARPQKKGLDYFPFDVGFFDDWKIKELRGKFGWDAVIIYQYILCHVYKDNGYYLQFADGFDYVMAADLNMSSEKIGQVINFLCERSLLNGTLYASDKVLTSRGIQLRFQEAVKSRAAKTEIEVGKYWLLSESETQGYIKRTDFQSYSEKNLGYSEKNNDCSKEKTHKEKESKKNYIKSTIDDSCNQIVNSYNEICVDLPKVKNLTDKRKGIIRARLKKYTLEQFREIFTIAQKSDFICGRSGKDWKASFDWLMNENNLIKVAEGIYNNPKKHSWESRWDTNNGMTNKEIEELIRSKM